MRCKRVGKWLMAYHDGELGRGLTGRIRRHLEKCPACSNALKALEKTDRAAGIAQFPDPGPEYWESFTDRVMERAGGEAGDTAAKAPRLRGFYPVRLAPALSIALVAVVAAGVLLKIRQPVSPVQPYYGDVRKSTGDALPSRVEAVPSRPEPAPG